MADVDVQKVSTSTIVLFFIFFMILLPAVDNYVLFKNHFVFLLSDAPKFRNRGRQQKGVFFQAAISSPGLDKNKQNFFFELLNMYIIM